MMIDHIAFRVKDKLTTARFFVDYFGYLISDEFHIDFDNGTKASCFALTKKGQPEFFISDGEPGSIVGDWVKDRKDVGGIHHIAWRVDSVLDAMAKFRRYKMAQFTSDKPMECPGLIQIFTTEHDLTGITMEFIQRTGKGFCAQNVKALMESSEPKCYACDNKIQFCLCPKGE